MTPTIRRIGRSVFSAIVETVYPKVCAGCGMRGAWLCPYCEDTVSRATQAVSCSRCGVPMVDSRCNCVDLDPVIYRARSAFVYDGWAAKAVQSVKYQLEPARSEHLALFMQSELGTFGALDGLIPVPLHPTRERQRGFNQSRLLAEHLSAQSGIPVLDVLRRTRASVSQTTLSGQERKTNVAGIFATSNDWVPVAGGRFLLIDDVRTTGATVNACADALRGVSPSMIGVLTFALDMSRDRVATLKAQDPAVRFKAGN